MMDVTAISAAQAAAAAGLNSESIGFIARIRSSPASPFVRASEVMQRRYSAAAAAREERPSRTREPGWRLRGGQSISEGWLPGSDCLLEKRLLDGCWLTGMALIGQVICRGQMIAAAR